MAQKRRRAAKRMKRFLEAERAIWEALPQEGEGLRQKGDAAERSRHSWQSARGGSRRFCSLQMEPLTPEDEGGPKVAEVACGVREGGVLDRIKGDGRSLFLFAVEIASLAAFLLILSNYRGRLRSLGEERVAGTPQHVAVAAATATSTVAPSATASRDTEMRTRAETVHQREGALPSPSRESSPEPTSEEATPLPRAAVPRRLVIPSIGVDAPIVQGDTDEALEKGVGYRLGSVDAGARGNMVLAAHNDIQDEIFRDLHTLEPGAEVHVYTDERTFHYVVQSIEVVLPTKIEVMEPTDDARLTMITCHPYMLDTHRVVAVAHLEE